MRVIRRSVTYDVAVDYPVNIMKTSRDVLSMIAGIYNISKEEVLARGEEGVTIIRYEFFYRAVKLPGMSMKKLAGLYGFDHTTVQYGISKYAYLNNRQCDTAFTYKGELKRRTDTSRVSYSAKKFAYMKSLVKAKARHELSECQKHCQRLKLYWKRKGYNIKASPELVKGQYNIKKNYKIQTDLVRCVPEGFKYLGPEPVLV